MDDDELTLVSGEAETIVIKPEFIELLFDVEDPYWSEEDFSEGSEFEALDKNCFVTTSGEVITINYEDIVQTPFCLENYFMDNDVFRSRSLSMPVQPQIIEIDRVTCYECNIVFCNEHKLLEHLMTHIDVYRMGCEICDKDLNLEEKFQLHMMAVTWQSVYYCDFCRKSCAGVVRSKTQPPPPGKTYMCHDCEYQTNQETMNFQYSIRFYENVIDKPTPDSAQLFSPALPLTQPQDSFPLSAQISSHSLSQPAAPSITQPSSPPPPPAEVLQEHKQKPTSEVKHEICEYNSSPEVQDCYKSPPKKKENKKCRRPKPKVQVVSESMRHTLKMSTRSHTRNKPIRNYRCRYCPVAFTEHSTLMTHLREKHKFHKLRYVCKLCGKEFVQQRCYENHVSFHQLTKNHMCFVCNLAFLSKYELEQHAKLHDKNIIIDMRCDNSESISALDLRKKKNKDGT